MEQIRSYLRSLKVSAALRVLPKVILLVLLALVEDTVLWYAPGISYEFHSKSFSSRCAELKTGMSQSQVMKIIHRGSFPLSESKTTDTGGAYLLQFTGQIGTCSVQLDAATGTTVSVNYSDFNPF